MSGFALRLNLAGQLFGADTPAKRRRRQRRDGDKILVFNAEQIRISVESI
jgi:hypothetical protein